ncbi:hypothetical protein AYO20_03319 [Fonsecaea nubica]|uniref:Uncharacterized protein n=1 Tax=Fonsecaea nubica TaxID=856822 RepID=A0A178D5F2_9EURO|nr:hypothetical protein AYO20_03319 [Fonsecaea nubica]OAL37470.1 hypothetical protein AYO20_03319 [Fonsecaea nubica]
MIRIRHAVICLVFATFVTLGLYYGSVSGSITVKSLQSKVPQIVGLGDYFDSDNSDVQNQSQPASTPGDGSGASNATSGSLATTAPTGGSSGSRYTRSLVMARLKEESVTWLDGVDLGADIKKFIYIADDPTAPLHPPKNKGHEVMTYLTYIIEFYDQLPDVSIFMHAHQDAWHNNELLNWDAAEMIKRLSSERVQRQGYMNMRCHWKPGCPDWIHPGQIQRDKDKLEQSYMASTWAELFVDKPIPAVLAQPCCSQFAVSRNQIRLTPRETYRHYRDWLLRSEISDVTSGRIFEYIWQVIFANESVFCPSQRACYCDGYGVCFETDKTFDKWFELRYERQMAEKELREWEEKAEAIEKFRDKDGRLPGIEAGELQVPEIGRKEQLEASIEEKKAELERRRLEALERGRDPRIRAESDGRPWKEGDGF